MSCRLKAIWISDAFASRAVDECAHLLLQLFHIFSDEVSMSGSSGGGGGGGIGSREVSCDGLSFRTQLASPQAAVVATLAVGHVLQVRYLQVGTAQVLVAQANGQNVGSLLGVNATRLRECILANHQYVATVVQIHGGQVTVDVAHV